MRLILSNCRCFLFVLILNCLTNVSFLNAQTFERVEKAVGLGGLEKNNGVAVADYDGDNDLDVFVVAKSKDDNAIPSSHSKLFRNNNDGTFTDVTDSSGLMNLFPSTEVAETFAGLSGYKNGAFWGDYDNDGFPDLFLTNTTKIQLFHNKKDGTFIEVTDQAGFQKYNGCLNTSATWFDYNKDGFLDIYINVWSTSCSNKLYKNNGNGTFSDVSAIFKGVVNKLSYQSIPFDFNNDGWMDLYVANDYVNQKNDLFINNKGQEFDEQANLYGLDHAQDDMGIAVGDYNNDGFFDLFVTAIDQNALYRNNGNGSYINEASTAGVMKTGWAWDVNFSDFDLDGDEDLFIVNGFMYGSSSSDFNQYFENLYPNGGNVFVNSTSKTNLGEKTISVGEAVFDYDNDGDLDILVTNNDQASFFYENKITDFTIPRSDLHWFQLKLQGTVSNRDGIGAKVSIKTNKGQLFRYYSGVGFLSQSLKPIHFGLGTANEIIELKISWPSGLVESYSSLPVDKVVLAKEGAGYTVLNIEPTKKIHGCMDTSSCNYNPYATVSSGNCSLLTSKTLSGNKNVLFNSIETYSYPIDAASTAVWEVSGGTIVEGGTSGTIKVQWSTANQGVVSVIEKSSKCSSAKVSLNITLSSVPVVDPSNNYSVARLWNEALLAAIRKDYARPTVHARNLFHTSVAMYDAWAVFDGKAQTYLLGNELHGFSSKFDGFSTTENLIEARKKAISYAAYRLLTHRFSNSPGKVNSQANFDALMNKLGYDIANISVDYSTGDAAALGNYIAQTLIEYGLVDGSNEANQFKNIYYKPVNQPLNLLNPVEFPISSIDPNRWQPLKFDSFIDQSGNFIPGSVPNFLSPEWGNVFPFSLKESDKQVYERLGNNYNVYHDPGTPPNLSLDQNTKSSEAYKWGFQWCPNGLHI